MVSFALVYSHLNHGIANWVTANRSGVFDLVKFIELYLLYSKLIVKSVFHSQIYFIQHGYHKSKVSTIMN